MSTRATVYYADGNLTRVVHSDPTEGFYGGFTLQTFQDVEPVIEGNRALRDQQTGREHFRLVARVPVAVYERACREGWAFDDDAWRRWLNDSDNRDFRVWEGRV